ncbi:MAG: flavodoxin family protein [Methanomassiliicoccales archaeon]|nr:flavodoxin family protein [Methanomassiliicoccales archaeon]
MKILALNGSPRKDGNTAKFLKELTKEHKDVDLEYFDLGDLKIKDCIGCFYCKKNEGCSIKDDMTMLYHKIQHAEALIIGSPVYFGAETALTKAFLDRMYTMLNFGSGPGIYISKIKGTKKVIIVFTCGNGKGNEIYTNLKDRMYSAYGLLGFSEVHPYIIPGVRPTIDILELQESQKVLQECHVTLGEE